MTKKENPTAGATLEKQMEAEREKLEAQVDNIIHSLMEQLNTLSGSLAQTSVMQKDAVTELVTSSTSMLRDVGEGFSAFGKSRARRQRLTP